MEGYPDPYGGLTTEASLPARLAGRLRRAWATEKGRRRIVVSAGTIIVVVTLAIVVSLFASLAGESQAYRDGYSEGGQAYAVYSDTNTSSVQACRAEENVRGVRPARDNSAQWIQGCVAAFNFAQSDS